MLLKTILCSDQVNNQDKGRGDKTTIPKCGLKYIFKKTSRTLRTSLGENFLDKNSAFPMVACG